MTGDLAEMTLMADLMKLEAGMFKDQAGRDQLVKSALRSAEILSKGEQALAEIVAKLKSL